VRGLHAEDFELRDEGVRRLIEPVLLERAALDVVLVLDHSGSVVGEKLDLLRQAAGVFLDGLRADDRAALLFFGEEVSLAEDLTADLAAVRRALDRPPPGGGTALNDALYAALRLRRTGPRRLAVLVFSDGIDNSSWLSQGELLALARRSDALVHAIAVSPRKGEPPVQLLPEIASLTGGRTWTLRRVADLLAAFREVLEDLRERYVLTYPPSPDDAPGWHRLQVRLKRRRGEVLARRGYWRD
jgi:Ca-activated chloride channel family protein